MTGAIGEEVSMLPKSSKNTVIVLTTKALSKRVESTQEMLGTLELTFESKFPEGKPYRRTIGAVQNSESAMSDARDMSRDLAL